MTYTLFKVLILLTFAGTAHAAPCSSVYVGGTGICYGNGYVGVAPGSVIYGNGSSQFATTSGTNGQILAWLNGIPTPVATTTFGTGLSYSNGQVTNTGVLSNSGDWAGTWQTFAPSHFLTSLIGAASSTLLTDSNTFSGTNIITGTISGNAGTVTNGVYTTTFGNLFDVRLAATTSVKSITTLGNLSITKSQVSDFGTYEAPLTFNYPLTRSANAISTAATSTAYGTGTNGQVLMWSGSTPLWAATSSQVYPGAGISVSTGSAWGTSLTDFSSRWNSATTTFSSPLTYTVGTNAVTCSTCVTAVTATTPILSSGGATPALTWVGLATTTQPAISNLLASNGAAGVFGVATGTVSAGSSAITVTAGRSAVGGALAIDCATSGSGQNGCLSSGDWSTFNIKQAAGFQIGTSSTIAISQLAYFTNTGTTLSGVATTSETCSTGVSCTAHAVLTGGGAITLAALGSAGVLGAVTATTPTAQATSTLYGAATGGKVLGWNNDLNGIGWIATSSSAGGITALTGAVTGSGSGSVATAFGVMNTGVLTNNLAAATIPTPQATSTLYGAATGGQVLGWNNTTSAIGWIATSSGSGAAFAWTPSTNYAVNTNATSTILWPKLGVTASSTSYFDQINIGSSTISQMSTSTNYGNSSTKGLASSTTMVVSSLGSAATTNICALAIGYLTITGCNNGTVTAVSVVSSNGFTGSSSGGATPALTLTTSITGLLAGNGTAISAAALTNFPTQAANTVIANGTANTVAPTAIATSTFFGQPVQGNVLSFLNGINTWTATTTFNSPLTYLQGAVSCATCLTGNQSITLSGVVTGTGATSITTAFGSQTAGVLGSAVTGNTTVLATSTMFGNTATFGIGKVGVGSSTPSLQMSIQGNTGRLMVVVNQPLGTGAVATTTVIIGNTSTTTSKSSFEMNNTAGAVSCLYIVGTTVTVSAGACK